MKTILTLILVSMSFLSCAQKNQGNTKQIQIDSIKRQNEYIAQSVAFIEIINQKESIRLSDNVDKNDFYSCLEQLKQDTVTFTKTELEYITNHSKNPPIKKWTKELVPAATIISADSVNKIFKDNTKGWDYFYKNLGRDFTTFSAPIFLRANQYCVFYSAIHCGWLCGGGQLTLYKKDGAIWKKIRSYCNWIS